MERAAVRAVVTGLRCFVTCVSWDRRFILTVKETIPSLWEWKWEWEWKERSQR